MKDAFSDYHPMIILIYFLSVLGFTMFLHHPVCLGIAVLSATVYSICLCGRRGAGFSIRYLLPMAGMILLINPLINHQGLTILGYFPNGNPFTLEAILYGFMAAGILIALIQWFSCWNQIMTTDKLVYLFGRVMPAFSLVISMTLRFVPRYRQHFKKVMDAQRQLGTDQGRTGLYTRIRTGIRVLSGTLTWAIEHAVETGDSMKSRGYGLPGRTAFSLYRWTRRDTIILAVILLLSGVVIAGILQGRLYWTCFPTIRGADTDLFTISIYISYGILSLLPILLHGREALRWNHSFR